MSIKILKDKDNNDIFPITLEDAVFDSDGVKLSEKMDKFINWGEEIGEVEIDVAEDFSKKINDINERIEVLEQNKIDQEAIDNKQNKTDENLNTTDKSIVGAINEIKSELDTKVDKTVYDTKIGELTTSIEQAFQYGNNAKQKLVGALIAKGKDVSTSNSFEDLINTIKSLNTTKLPAWKPTSNTTLQCQSLPVDCCNHGSSAYGNDIYIIGGDGGSAPYDTVYCYNTIDNTVVEKTKIPMPLYYHTTDIYGSTIYAIGGIVNSTTDLSTVYKYDCINDKWTSGKSLSSSISHHCSTILNTVIYLFGDFSTSAYFFIMYDVTTESCTLKQTLPESLYDSAASTVNGLIYVFGGQTTNGFSANVHCYDPISDSWSYKASLPYNIRGHSVSAIGDFIYLSGGAESNSVTNYIRCYDTVNNIWTLKANSTYYKMYHSTTACNGKMYIIGGDESSVIECYIP